MGGHVYWYFTPYQPDLNSALQNLRQQEFEAGRYNPMNPFPFDPDFNEEIKAEDPDLYPGNDQCASIEEAIEASEESGTHSILDIFHVSDSPAPCATSPISTELLLKLFKTDKPSRQLVEAAFLSREPLAHWEEEGFDKYRDIFIERGECRHIVCYSDNQPSEIFFTGYSFD